MNIGKDIQEYLEKADFVSLSETWIEAKDMEKLEKKLSKHFI